ncbi:16S rRNA (guanine(527)-N(7))-methyltransferase RsmG [Pontivivens nitratireducens]|uniref:Ribosomal RNA small subunit methyltransferase G n=1 Tax=Pontivivens nitratireducens TaxID=2758038 RepID=A0A6G7VIQ7_9RHOB|nr:16S rRNA (guanine(527)-N(7))-methyltransferase RsmG [Pontibrevibacter nitratireducens]QIK39822.1 16S rRNA (guanine(527)-N(7))-methyltransferase RsmG [Pontibrevibacter nitratireducens]
MRAIDRYVELLIQWNPKINLVAPNTIPEVWTRHVLDSLQIAHLGEESRRWVDIGSGGGFPGLIVACMYPEKDLVLVESDTRKCLFMRTVIRECKLSAKVMNHRIEELEPQSADVVSARALASLPSLFTLAKSHLSSEGQCLFMKGANRKLELEAARKDWTFDVEEVQSLTSREGAILRIKGLKHI